MAPGGPFEHELRKRLLEEVGGVEGKGRDEQDIVQARLEHIDQKIRALIENVSPENISLLDTELTRLRKEREKAQKSLGQLKQKGGLPRPSKQDAEQLVETTIAKMKSLASILQHEASEEDRAEFFRLFVAKILISTQRKTGTVFVRRPRFVSAIIAGALDIGFEDSEGACNLFDIRELRDRRKG